MEKKTTIIALAFICAFGLIGALLPSNIAKANNDNEIKIIKEISPIVERENDKYIAKPEDNARYTIIEIYDTKIEPYVEEGYVNIYEETILLSNTQNLETQDYNKYVILNLRANEGYEFDNNLAINLPEEYAFINATTKNEGATVVLEYSEPSNDNEIKELVKEEPELFGLVVSKNKDSDTNKDILATNQTDNRSDSMANLLYERHIKANNSDNANINNEKLSNIPKTDDNFLPLLVVIAVMILTSGIGTVILCRRYC